MKLSVRNGVKEKKPTRIKEVSEKETKKREREREREVFNARFLHYKRELF
jgi:hypothetical protein